MNLIYPEFQVLASFSAELFQFLFRLNSSQFFSCQTVYLHRAALIITLFEIYLFQHHLH